MNIYIVENNRIVGTNTYPDIDDTDCIVVDGVRSELEDIEQVDGVYYYGKINEDKSITNYTTETKVAKALGWINNSIMITDTEVSELNGWTYLKGYAPKKPLETLKEEKHTELKSIMQAKRNVLTCHYDGDDFDCNTDAQNNINSLLLFAETMKDDATVGIRSSNETTHNFTKVQLNELSALMVQAVNTLYAQYWELKDALAKATTAEEVNAIAWS